MIKYRVYACGKVVHEDDFGAEDSSIPYTDDYATYEIPEAIIDSIEEGMQSTMKHLTGQQLVEEILRRAKDTNFSCGDPEQSTEVLKTHTQTSNEALAMTLVGAFHAKYDLVSILQATLDILTETQRAAGMKMPMQKLNTTRDDPTHY